MTCCAASIAFPMCWFACDTADDDSTIRTKGNSICYTHRNLSWLATLRAYSINDVMTSKCHSSVACIQNSFARKVPSGDATRRSMECETLSSASNQSINLTFTGALFTPYKGKKSSICEKCGYDTS